MANNINTFKIPTTSAERKDEAMQAIANRSVLFDKDEKNFYVKYDDELVPIGGTQKQDVLDSGKNIEIEGNSVKTKEDVDFDTVQVSPEGMSVNWIAGQKIASLENNRTLLLFKKGTAGAFIGGEIFADINDGTVFDHHNLSMSSMGSRSYVGLTENSVKSTLVEAQVGGNTYYGIQYPMLNIESSRIIHHTLEDSQKRAIIRIARAYNTNNFSLWNEDNSASRALVNTNTPDSNRWQYIKMSSLANLIPFQFQNETMQKYINGDYQLWFHVFTPSGSPTRYRINYIALTPSWNYGTTEDIEKANLLKGPDGETVYASIEENVRVPIADFGYTGTVPFRPRNYADAAVEMFTMVDVYDEEVKSSENTPITKVDVFLNGWKKIPEEFAPPENYSDSDLVIIPLADEANQSTGNVEIPGSASGSTVDTPIDEVISGVFEELPELGVDNDPHVLKLTGTFNKAALDELSNNLKGDPDLQTVVDMSGCTLAADAVVWDWAIFANCHRLRGLVLPPNLQQITANVFSGCLFLRYVDFTTATSLTAIAGKDSNHAFFEGTRVFNVIFPDSLTELSGNIFETTAIANVYLTGKHNVTGGGLNAGWMTMRAANLFDWLKVYVPEGYQYYQYNIGDLSTHKNIHFYNVDEFDFNSVDTSYRT